MNILSDCITGIDGKTVDPSRLYGGLVILVYLGLSIYSVLHNGGWDPLHYGLGAGGLLSGFGFGVKLKSDTEPKE